MALNHFWVNCTEFVHSVFLVLSTATATKSSLFFFVSPLVNAAECEMCFIGKMDEPALDFLGFMASGKDCLHPFCKRTYFTVLWGIIRFYIPTIKYAWCCALITHVALRMDWSKGCLSGMRFLALVTHWSDQHSTTLPYINPCAVFMHLSIHLSTNYSFIIYPFIHLSYLLIFSICPFFHSSTQSCILLSYHAITSAI